MEVFQSYLSNLWYWNKALSSQSIKSIVSNGPNLTMKNNKNLSKLNQIIFL